MSYLIYAVPVLGLIGLLVMIIKAKWVNKQDAGDQKMQDLAKHIREGALAFLSAEYRVLAIFVVIAAVLLGIISQVVDTTHWLIVVAFVIGAFFSGWAGNIGMRIATAANVRTTQAARTSLAKALKVKPILPEELFGAPCAYQLLKLDKLPPIVPKAPTLQPGKASI